MRPFLRGALSATALSLAALGCGAKTGLLVPDVVAVDDATVDVADVTDAPDVVDRPVVRGCVPGQFQLLGRAADLVLVIDRSGSMNQGLGGARGTSRWRLLRDALAATLPVYQDTINVGALFYPEDGAASRSAACTFPNVPEVDVSPARGNAPRVLQVFDDTRPGGATPTASALLRAYTWIVRHPDPLRARYIVLATDGGPNCNTALDARTCVCVGGGRGCRGDATQCLDDLRAVDTVRQIAGNAVAQVPTYVLGISGDDDPAYEATLTSMAIAGGRPNRSASGAPTYYDARQPEDLSRAFRAIQNAIARCTFIAPTRPADTDVVTLTMNGATIARDTTRSSGWDWTDRAAGEITLFGAACPASDAPPAPVTATVECRDR
ncbi:MAG: vWA domain-containing protein [Polyangiales bacterium]